MFLPPNLLWFCSEMQASFTTHSGDYGPGCGSGDRKQGMEIKLSKSEGIINVENLLLNKGFALVKLNIYKSCFFFSFVLLPRFDWWTEMGKIK